jgi:glyoxylase I family protein
MTLSILARACALTLLGAGCASTQAGRGGNMRTDAFRFAGVRYQVADVDRSIAFYTAHLGFKLEMKGGAAFAHVSHGSLNLWLSGPGSSGARPMPDGRRQEPGGWNRLVLEVKDLRGCVESLKSGGLRFRNEIETGPGGSQIQIEDPDGNPIELFQPAGKP